MQRHSGRDWVGVLRHTEEQECVATGRDRQNSSAECGEKKGEVKKRKPTFTAHVQLHNPSIFRPSLNKIWKIQFAFVLLSENWTGVLAFAYFWVSTGCKQQKNFCYLKRKRKKKAGSAAGELAEICTGVCVCVEAFDNIPSLVVGSSQSATELERSSDLRAACRYDDKTISWLSEHLWVLDEKLT